MNQRTQELVEQATRIIETTDHCSGVSESCTEVDLEKFAELIVRECAYFSMVATDDHYDVDALYRHFGIEP